MSNYSNFIGIIAATLFNPITASAQDKSPSYNWVGAGYLWSQTNDSGISDLTGTAIVGSWEVRPRIVLQFGVEKADATLDPELIGAPADIGTVTATGSAFVATIGTYVPLTERTHITADIGVDYETTTITVGDLSESGGVWLANANAGVVSRVSDRIELSGGLQYLYDWETGEDTRWVSRISATYEMMPKVDLIGSISREEGENAIILGVRTRF